MENTLGTRIAHYRKQKGLKQDQLAEILGVSPQAVSKWENDQSCPDITLLPKLAKQLGISVDLLLSGEEEPSVPAVSYLPEEQRKAIKDMMLRVEIHTKDGDQVRVQLPMLLIQVALESGMDMSHVVSGEAVTNIDFAKIFNMVQCGVMGNLVDIVTKDGDTVRVFVE